MSRRTWTKQEEIYLEKKYLKLGSQLVAKQLKRSVYSVRRRAENLNISIYENEYLYVKTIAKCFSCDSSVINRWIMKYQLPYTVLQRKDFQLKGILAKDFWRWAENHKDIVPWEKYERYSILPEPDWVKEVCTEALKKKNNRKKITEQDMIYVWNQRNMGRTYSEIALALSRTEESVKHIYKKVSKKKCNKEVLI